MKVLYIYAQQQDAWVTHDKMRRWDLCNQQIKTRMCDLNIAILIYWCFSCLSMVFSHLIDLTWILQSSHGDMIKDMKATSFVVKTYGHVQELSCKLVHIHMVGVDKFLHESWNPTSTWNLWFRVLTFQNCVLPFMMTSLQEKTDQQLPRLFLPMVLIILIRLLVFFLP
jgi:hypothetical protein